jgi:hypothetical protein
VSIPLSPHEDESTGPGGDESRSARYPTGRGVMPDPGNPPPPTAGINPMITVEAVAFMLSKRLAEKLRPESREPITARYCTPTADEAAGKCCFPDGPTLKGEYWVKKVNGAGQQDSKKMR